MTKNGTKLLACLTTGVILGTACSPQDRSTPQDAQRTDTNGTISSPVLAPDTWTLPDEFTAVLGRFLNVETAPVKGNDGKWHLVYELWLTNGKQVPATIEKIEVLDGEDHNQVLATIEGQTLKTSLAQLSTKPAEDAILDPNESVLVFIELTFDSKDDLPNKIVHRFTGMGADNPGSREPVKISYLFTPWDISRRTPPVIGFPLAGDGWVVINGCCSNQGAHRGAVQTVNGTLIDSQRFAIDWMRMGGNNRLVEGDPADVNNWKGYNAPVYAVADATVVKVLDTLEDQVPGRLPDPRSMTLQTVDGNHVVLDLGNGIYAFYAHLKQGSILIKEGDTVTAGQHIANLGNTGNTSAHHLHLHLMTGPSPLASDGIPYVFDQFSVQGVIDREQWLASEDILDVWQITEADQPGPRQQELPLDRRIVEFPNPETSILDPDTPSESVERD